MRIWEILPKLFAAVRKSHEEVGLVGHHDFVHAARVGEIAYQIGRGEYDYQIAKLAGAAGLCHNANRVLQKKFQIGRKEVAASEVEKLVQEWLGEESWFVMSQFRPLTTHDDLTTEGKQRQVVGAVLKHDGYNSSNDSLVLIALMDADRIVNLDGDLFARSGQYYHDLAVVDYRYFPDFDPEATYRNPKTLFRDIAFSLDWVDPTSPVCIRTRLGKAMGERRARLFRQITDGLRDQLAEEGIIPYPFDK